MFIFLSLSQEVKNGLPFGAKTDFYFTPAFLNKLNLFNWNTEKHP